MRTSSDAEVASAEVALPDGVDLHARPAATCARAAMGFASASIVSSGEREANAKSLLSVLALGAKRGTTLALRAEGEDAEAAIQALVTVVAALTE